MNKYDWQSQLSEALSTFPAADERPLIGITGNYGEQNVKLAEGYYESVVRAGGVPVVLPPLADKESLLNTLDRLDGLLLSGGADYNPLYAGEEPQQGLGSINAQRDLPELFITRLAWQRQLPILGICRGIQTLAMALDGHVCQDIRTTSTVKHSQEADRSEATHSIIIEQDSTLYNIYKEQLLPLSSGETGGRLLVNSFHHQAVDDAGPRFRVSARATDGTIEAIESREFKSILGVQWHPECLTDGLPLFQWLVRQAQHYRQACQLHRRILTLDTHCDTPMFFPQGIDFGRRDERLCVDLHKMNEGRLDATIMVAYLPQPKLGETFSSKVQMTDVTPTTYADSIFDQIERIVNKYQNSLSIARTPADLYEDKRHGRHSVMLGIENGLALGGQLQNVKHFAQRGVVYITLCHNGDNDICDSARGCSTWGGLSAFGQQVVREMNRLGLMVDLSHAAEKSFYDALELSATPIVCSHSSCRALCDHPRNLTDDQMRALAAKGGVMQVTLYNGFLRTDGEATIRDAFDHLEHAIRIMGIDHVGLGTDFDGDGGIRGLSNASELINFTRQLLARHYSERDIQKIWGGNFLRVMTQVQAVR